MNLNELLWETDCRPTSANKFDMWFKWSWWISTNSLCLRVGRELVSEIIHVDLSRRWPSLGTQRHWCRGWKSVYLWLITFTLPCHVLGADVLHVNFVTSSLSNCVCVIYREVEWLWVTHLCQTATSAFCPRHHSHTQAVVWPACVYLTGQSRGFALPYRICCCLFLSNTLNMYCVPSSCVYVRTRAFLNLTLPMKLAVCASR